MSTGKRPWTKSRPQTIFRQITACERHIFNLKLPYHTVSVDAIDTSIISSRVGGRVSLHRLYAGEVTAGY